MRFHAVLFDVDGTLLDTLDDLAHSMNQVLAEKGYPTHPVPAYRYFVGEGVEKLVRSVLPPGRLDEATVSSCAAAMRAEYGRRWSEMTRPYEGIPPLLDALTALRVRLAVLSNKPDALTRAVVTRFLGRWRFEAVRGFLASMPRKPDPAAALQIARTLGLPPSEIVYLGDTRTDMATAVSAGMYPAGALWGFRTPEELLASGAKLLVQSPLDLLRLWK
ncbi:MAG: HAD family hydrolase [Planctomycetes bacterium]|nr:HAD family hydrolase [Planctomycetota bacterium]